MSAYLREEIAAADGVGVRYHTEVTGGGGDGRLAWLTLRDNAAGTTATVDAGALFILIGHAPTPAGCRRRSNVTTGDSS